MANSTTDQNLADRYRRYNQLCNAHAFDQLSEYVAGDVRVNAQPQGLADYTAGLQQVVAAFPDYRWHLEHLIVNHPMLAAHFTDTGTHTGEPFLGVPASGRAVRTAEFAIYDWSGGLIREVWVTTDRLDVLAQLQGGRGS